MKKMFLEDIAVLTKAPEHLYLQKGQKIFEKDEVIPKGCAEVMEKAGLEFLCAVSADEIDDFLFNTEYKPIDIENKDLFQEEGKLQRSLYSREGHLVLRSGSVWTMRTVEKLKRKNETILYLRRPKTAIKKDEERALEFKRRLDAKRLPVTSTGPESEIVQSLRDDFKSVDSSHFNPDTMDGLESKFKDSFAPDEKNALIDCLLKRDVVAERSDKEKGVVVKFHNQAFSDLKTILYGIAIQTVSDSNGLNEIAKKTVDILVRDKELLLNSVYLSDEFDDNFVIGHTIKSTIVSVNVALSMGFSSQQIYELAIGALLHDVGMLRIPMEILKKKTPLTEMDKVEIFKHPAHALDILQKVKKLPVSAPLVAYHCHERGDKTGYPKGRSMQTINIYARIIAVADIYCAMISQRSYREAFTPYSVMEFLTREAVSGKIDAKVFKAFLRVNSLYPLGSWVALNDGRIGKVIGADSNHYDCPVVRIFFENKKRVEHGDAIKLSEYPDVKVAKAFAGNKLKIDVMDGF